MLRDITLQIDEGEVIVVIGPSGSGKSTLCRTINRLEPIDSDSITIDGNDLPREGKTLAALRAKAGIIFQFFNLVAHHSVLDNVMLAPLNVRNLSQADAKKLSMELLDRIGVAEQADRYPERLSGRQQQLVVILQDTALGYIVLYPKVLRQAKLVGTSDSSLLPALVSAAMFIVVTTALGYGAQYMSTRPHRRVATSKDTLTDAGLLIDAD